MSLLLDTNVLSELRKGARANPHLRTWFDGVAVDEIYLGVLVVGEVATGGREGASKGHQTGGGPRSMVDPRHDRP